MSFMIEPLSFRGANGRKPLASLLHSLLLGSSSLLGLGSAELSSLEDRGGGELNVLLGADSHEVAGNVDELLAD